MKEQRKVPIGERSGADLSRAANFVWRTARLVDRARFAHLFLDGAPEHVVQALRAYQNEDGGFGHALEPDLRTPHSQPAAVRATFEILDQVGTFGGPLVHRACDYLMTITTGDGGVPFVVPSATEYPRAPWWNPRDMPRASAVFTAPIAGLLHKHEVAHPWLGPATAYSWRRVAAFHADDVDAGSWNLAKIGRSYEARALLAFLEHVPDRERARRAFDRLGSAIAEGGLATTDPHTAGEVHTALDYAPAPAPMARTLFRGEVIDSLLDALVAELGAPEVGTPSHGRGGGVEGGVGRGSSLVDRLVELVERDRIMLASSWFSGRPWGRQAHLTILDYSVVGNWIWWAGPMFLRFEAREGDQVEHRTEDRDGHHWQPAERGTRERA